MYSKSPRDITLIKMKSESLYYSTDPEILKPNPAGFLMQIIQPQDITHIGATPLANDSSSSKTGSNMASELRQLGSEIWW